MEHHIYRLWDMMKYKPICTCSSDVQHQQLNYNCCFRSKHNTEQETTLKWWGTALSWICHQTLQCQPSSSSQCPPGTRADRSFPGLRTNTTKHHHIWDSVCLPWRKQQNLQDTSCLVKMYLCILEDLGSVPYLHCSWLSVGSVILKTATVLVLQRPFELENNWVATERRKCPLHLYHASYYMLWGRQYAKWLFLETFVAGLVTAKGRMGSERCSQSQPCTKGGMGNGKSPPTVVQRAKKGKRAERYLVMRSCCSLADSPRLMAL